MAKTYAEIGEISASIREGKISSLEVVNECPGWIEELDQELDAFITVMAEGARERAISAGEGIESGNWLGPLHGIPVGIEDFEDRVLGNDAAVVAKLKEH